MKNKNWLLWIGIALASITIFVVGGFAGVMIYRELRPEPVLAPVALREPLRQSVGGAQILEVLGDGPADRAGILPGDIVLEIDDSPVSQENPLADLIGTYAPGDEITLTLRRAGSSETVDQVVTLDSHPDNTEQAYLGVRYRMGTGQIMYFAPPGQGRILPAPPVDLDEMLEHFDEMKEHMHFLDSCAEWHGIPESPKPICGLVVAEVVEGSPAKIAGIQVGDLILSLNGEPLTTAAAFSSEIQGMDIGDKITLSIYRGENDEELELSITLAENPREDGAPYLGITVPGFFHQFGPMQGMPFGEHMFQGESRFPLPEIIVPDQPAEIG